MNIFASSPCPKVSAATLADRHVVKMILETAQILSTAIERHVDPADFANFDGYKPTHRNHPCTRWAGDTRANFDWTVQHGIALGAEYTRRFSKVHKSQIVIERAWLWRDRIPVGALTDFAQAMPDVHRGPDPHSAYQRYLRAKYNDWRAAGRPPRWRAGIAR